MGHCFRETVLASSEQKGQLGRGQGLAFLPWG
jgi:hypothetical protein